MGYTKNNSIVTLWLGFALAAAPIATSFLAPRAIFAQSPTPAETAVESKEKARAVTVRVDGSPNMTQINTLLEQRYRAQFPNAQIERGTSGTDAALKALLADNIDIAAIGRPLTPQEQAQGLEEALLYREKIAIVVGKDNPFSGGLTTRQFAQIFRGEITDWSQVGGKPGRIRLIDRPDRSDLRQAFRAYPVFQEGQFATGANATALQTDDTDEMIRQLGPDGIGYAIASQVLPRPDVQVVAMHKTLPDDVRYPFSEPFIYAYKADLPPEKRAFVDFASSPTEQQELATAIASGKIAASPATEPSPVGGEVPPEGDIANVPAVENPTAENPTEPIAQTPETEAPETETAATPADTEPPEPGQLATNAVGATDATETPSDAPETIAQASETETAPSATEPRSKPIWLLLLPLGLAGGALWWMMNDAREIAGEDVSEAEGLPPREDGDRDRIDQPPAAAVESKSALDSNLSGAAAISGATGVAIAAALDDDEEDDVALMADDPTEDETPTGNLVSDTASTNGAGDYMSAEINGNGANYGLADSEAALAGGTAGLGVADDGDRLPTSAQEDTLEIASDPGDDGSDTDIPLGGVALAGGAAAGAALLSDREDSLGFDADSDEPPEAEVVDMPLAPEETEDAAEDGGLSAATMAVGAAAAAGAAVVGAQMLGDRTEDASESAAGTSNTVFPGEVFVNLADFDSGIRQAIPGYEEMLESVALGVPTQCRRILDLGSGTGALSLQLLDRAPEAQIVGLDYSPRMLRFARAKIDATPHEERWTGVEADFGELAKGKTLPEVEEKFDACVSSFAIHHLDDEMKQQLFEWVAQHLVPGGYFWNADPMLAESDALAEKYKALREEWARQNGVDLETVRSKMGQSILEGCSGPDRLATLSQHLEMMTRAGFTSLSVPWKFYGYAVFGGRV